MQGGVKMISEEHNLSVIDPMQNNNTTLCVQTLFLGFRASKEDNLVTQDETVTCRYSFFNDLIYDILFWRVTKKIPLSVQREKRA
jgi:hypothetical protein